MDRDHRFDPFRVACISICRKTNRQIDRPTNRPSKPTNRETNRSNYIKLPLPDNTSSLVVFCLLVLSSAHIRLLPDSLQLSFLISLPSVLLIFFLFLLQSLEMQLYKICGNAPKISPEGGFRRAWDLTRQRSQETIGIGDIIFYKIPATNNFFCKGCSPNGQNCRGIFFCDHKNDKSVTELD